MSFTEDELQSFNTILEQRLTAHRREMERKFDQREIENRRELEQKLITVQADALRAMSQKLSDIQIRLDSVLSEKLNAQQTRVVQAISSAIEQRQQQFEGSINRKLATQLSEIEQLLNEYAGRQVPGDTAITNGIPSQFEAIEVQTELPWEELNNVIVKALDERLSMLNDAIQRSLKTLEKYLSVRLGSLREEFLRNYSPGQGKQAIYNGNATSIQEVLSGIEHLEHIIESMQVAMTSNHALLSNRLFHHQQLPLERAHLSGDYNHSMPDGIGTPLSTTEGQGTLGLEADGIPGQRDVEEQKGS